MWTGKLSCRIILCSNEMPELGDASGAIAGRFVTVQLTKSWLGKEDPELEADLDQELPGILNWALDGLRDWKNRIGASRGPGQLSRHSRI